jgi:hypothetical protein
VFNNCYGHMLMFNQLKDRPDSKKGPDLDLMVKSRRSLRKSTKNWQNEISFRSRLKCELTFLFITLISSLILLHIYAFEYHHKF